MRTKHAPVRRAGFSLVELMIVVAITGILAATAIPTFTEYIYKSRTSEAVSFLGVIKLKQEAYRAEFGQYLGCPIPPATGRSTLAAFDAGANFVPSKATFATSESVLWTGTDACFNTLGASPDGRVRFRYSWIAGTPADFAGSGIAGELGPATMPADHYVVAQAHADLDDDGTWCVFELASFTRNIWIGDENDNDLAAGWE